MSQQDLISAIVREVLTELSAGPGQAPAGGVTTVAPAPATAPSGGLDPARDFPLASKRPDLIKTGSGKSLDQVTLEAALKGEIVAEELRITPETLELQAQISEKAGRPQLARNIRRAAELTRVSDERVLQIYNALRPYRSTKAELLAIADELENKYGARINAAFVREAAGLYERRGRLRQE
jgi:propanediol dehydratase small subunit